MTAPETGFEIRREAGDSVPDWTTLAEEEQFLNDVQQLAPSLVEVAIIGTSTQDRPLRSVRVGSPSTKPTYLIEATIHGNEPAPREGALQFVRNLVVSSPAWLDDAAVIVIPTSNPDGRVANTRNDSTGVDLNRRFARLDRPEARAITREIVDFSPVFVATLHEIAATRSNDVEVLWALNTEADATQLTEGHHIATEVWQPAFTAAGVSNTVYSEGLSRSNANPREWAALYSSVALLLETTGADSDNRPRQVRVDNQQLGLDVLLDYFVANLISLSNMQQNAIAAQLAEGHEPTRPFDMQTTEALDPAPVGYLLDAQQMQDASDLFAATDLGSYKSSGGTVVPMGQRARGMIPFMLDGESSLTNAPPPIVSATRLLSLPLPLRFARRGGQALPLDSHVVRDGSLFPAT